MSECVRVQCDDSIARRADDFVVGIYLLTYPSQLAAAAAAAARYRRRIRFSRRRLAT